VPISVLNQAAERCDLRWTENDPISFEFIAKDVDWSGSYVAEIRGQVSRGLLSTLTVTATFASGDTTFTMIADTTESAKTPAGTHVWDLQQVGGVTRLSGYAYVQRGSTVP